MKHGAAEKMAPLIRRRGNQTPVEGSQADWGRTGRYLFTTVGAVESSSGIISFRDRLRLGRNLVGRRLGRRKRLAAPILIAAVEAINSMDGRDAFPQDCMRIGQLAMNYLDLRCLHFNCD